MNSDNSDEYDYDFSFDLDISRKRYFIINLLFIGTGIAVITCAVFQLLQTNYPGAAVLFATGLFLIVLGSYLLYLHLEAKKNLKNDYSHLTKQADIDLESELE